MSRAPWATLWQVVFRRVGIHAQGGEMQGRERGMTDAEILAALRRRPYDRAAREAARRLEELLTTPRP